jgi:phage-related protein
MGDELQLIQFGGMPKDAKPFKGIGSGVFEIALRYDTDAYRTVLAVQLGKKIYVLHAFQLYFPGDPPYHGARDVAHQDGPRTS